MLLLVAPTDLERQALRNLGRSADGERALAYLKRALDARDQSNRLMIDAVQLRMGQGAAVALAEIIGLAEGKASVGALSDTREVLAGGANRTP